MSDEKSKPDIRDVVAVDAGHDGVEYRPAGSRFKVDIADPRFKESTWFVEPDKVPEPKGKPTDKRVPGAGPAKGSAVKDGANPAG